VRTFVLALSLTGQGSLHQASAKSVAYGHSNSDTVHTRHVTADVLDAQTAIEVLNFQIFEVISGLKIREVLKKKNPTARF